MRRLIMILAMISVAGCASMSSPEERHERIAKWFKEWWKGSDSSGGSYQDESDASKAHHEQTVIRSLNSDLR